MKFFITIALLMVISLTACKSTKATSSNYATSVKEITQMLNQDAKHWSDGNVEAFMGSYIKSDSLVFIGKNGLTYGWQQTLDNYKKGYPTKEHMGTLKFDLLEFKELAVDAFLVIGKYNLKRTIGDASGYFSIILKKIDGKWKIIADHSS
ncbi:YybH family protein [Aureibaculum conchae]|uniref:YybH family protein n=1 Tax=Aureibaculum sp. 2308TA14-22 TaxID=3108392 RepID=UPI003397EBD0